MLCGISVVINSVGDVLGLVSYQRGSESRQVLVGFQSTEAFDRFQHAGGRPAGDDLRSGFPRRLIQRLADGIRPEGAFHVDRALATTVALGPMTAGAEVAPVDAEHMPTVARNPHNSPTAQT